MEIVYHRLVEQLCLRDLAALSTANKYMRSKYEEYLYKCEVHYTYGAWTPLDVRVPPETRSWALLRHILVEVAKDVSKTLCISHVEATRLLARKDDLVFMTDCAISKKLRKTKGCVVCTGEDLYAYYSELCFSRLTGHFCAESIHYPEYPCDYFRNLASIPHLKEQFGNASFILYARVLDMAKVECIDESLPAYKFTTLRKKVFHAISDAPLTKDSIIALEWLNARVVRCYNISAKLCVS